MVAIEPRRQTLLYTFAVLFHAHETYNIEFFDLHRAAHIILAFFDPVLHLRSCFVKNGVVRILLGLAALADTYRVLVTL